MLKHLTLASLASALVLSVAASGPASANRSFGHARYFGHPGARPGGHFHAHSYFGRRRVVHLPGHSPRFHWWHHRHGSHGWHYGVGYYGGYPVYDGGVAVSTPAPAACTCLTKTYLQDGTVVFADQCTKESAAAPAGPAPRG